MKTTIKPHQIRAILVCLVAAALITALPGCSSHQARMQELSVQFQENARQRAEAARQRQEEYARRKEEHYTAWFNGLSREQQVAVINEKEKSERTRAEAEGRVWVGGIEALSNAIRPKYYVVEE